MSNSLEKVRVIEVDAETFLIANKTQPIEKAVADYERIAGLSAQYARLASLSRVVGGERIYTILERRGITPEDLPFILEK